MNFLEPIMLNGLASLIWPLCRIGAFLTAMFMIGGNSVPPYVRALFALMLTVCALPSIPAVSLDLEPFSGRGILVTINQVLIGFTLGFVTQFLAQTFVIAGQIVAMQTGLGFASLVDPVSGTNAPVVGQFFSILTTLVFFAVDGHLVFIRLMLLSFETMPIGTALFAPNSLSSIFYFGSLMFACALSMSISAICSMLVVNFTFGVMTRAAPQLNVFSMGFAVSMMVGLFVLVISLNAYLGNFTVAINELMSETCNLMGTACEGIF